MNLVLVTAPTIEPITLAELKVHMYLNSEGFADGLDQIQSLAPASYAIANDYITHVGEAVQVGQYNALVVLNSGTNEATGTVDVKIQECDTADGTYNDWTDGAFTQVTTANDNAIQEKRYSGAKDYIRTVAKVLNAACVFGTSVVRSTGSVVQDDQLTDDIQTAREQAEVETRRKLLTQTWDYFFEFFPSENNFIDIPFGNLQSVTYIKYIDSDGDITTLTEDTDYIVETNGEECGRVILPYAGSWPSFTPFPSHPIVIRFVCGWESAAEIPRTIKTAVKEIAARLYTMRGDPTIGKGQYVVEDEFYRRLLYDHRIFKDL